MHVALPIVAGFAFGLVARGRLQRHFAARLAATALAVSMAAGAALLPLAVWLARHGPAT